MLATLVGVNPADAQLAEGGKAAEMGKKSGKGTKNKRADLCWRAIAKRLGRFFGLLQRGDNT